MFLYLIPYPYWQYYCAAIAALFRSSQQLCNFVEIILWHRCSTINLMQIFRALFLRTPIDACFWLFSAFLDFLGSKKLLSFSGKTSLHVNFTYSVLKSLIVICFYVLFYFINNVWILTVIRVATCHAYKCTNKARIHADSVFLIFRGFNIKKSEANKLIEVFAYDDGNIILIYHAHWIYF